MLVTIPPEEMQVMHDVLTNRRLQEQARNDAIAAGISHTFRREKLPLRDEDGDDWGEVVASIPKETAFRYLTMPGFGVEGLLSEDGLKDVLKAHPEARVTTVSGKVRSGYRGSGRSSQSRVRFGPGTMEFAK